jgi:hypothetical protein
MRHRTTRHRTTWSRAAQIALLLVCPLLVGGNDDLASRRQRVLDMSPAEQARLVQNRDQFAKLDWAEQARIRQLCRDIEQDANTEQLRQVMHRYCRWLKTLPSNQRFELAAMPADERLASIRRLKRDASDEEGLRGWLEKHRKNLAQRKPQDQRVPEPRPDHDPRHPEALRAWAERARRDWAERIPVLTAEDLASLRGALSPETARELEALSLDEQRRRVGERIREMLKDDRISRWLSGPRPAVSDEELTKYFDEELSDEQRNMLLALPGDEMRNRLRELYQQRKLGGGAFPRKGPDGPPHEGPPPDRSDNPPR